MSSLRRTTSAVSLELPLRRRFESREANRFAASRRDDPVSLGQHRVSRDRLCSFSNTSCPASRPAIIHLGQLLFKLLLMNCRHDQAALQACQAAAQRSRSTAPQPAERSATPPTLSYFSTRCRRASKRAYLIALVLIVLFVNPSASCNFFAVLLDPPACLLGLHFHRR